MKRPDWQTRTPLARQALVVYVLSVFVTASLGAALTYGCLRQALETGAQARLTDEARLYGLAVFSRLEEADRALAWLTTASGSGAEILPAQPDPESPLASVRFVSPDATDADGDPDGKRARARELAAVAERTVRNSTFREST